MQPLCFPVFPNRWVTQPELCRELRISRTQLWRLRQSGHLRPGSHWRRSGWGIRSALLFNAPACEMALGLYLGQ